MVRKAALAILLAPVGTGLVAMALILSQWPELDPRNPAALDAMAAAEPQAPLPLEQFRARDGTMLGYRIWQSEDAGGASGNEPLVIMLHGAGGHSGWMATLASGLVDAVPATVVAPDLRGHGPNPIRRGDVGYIGQYEDDLADLIAHLDPRGREVILLGHSAGGGLVIRFAGGAHRALADRAVLVAPFLQHDAPTALPSDGSGWARPLTRRIAGLWMLNAVGATFLNHLVVVQFRFPADLLEGPAAALATRNYSYRLQFGYSPRRDWQKDAAALPPYLLVAGSADTTFRADSYEPALSPVAAQGRFMVIEGAGHADILQDERLVVAVAAFVGDAD